MKRNRLIGIALITASILLQVGYAATTTQITNVNVGGFDVKIHSIVSNVNTQNVSLAVSQESKSSIAIKVGNLYPGANFTVEPTVTNVGTVAARIKNISIKVLEGEKLAPEVKNTIYKSIVGYNTQTGETMSLAEYNTYLNQTYGAKEIVAQGNLKLQFGMGMDSKVADNKLQNQQVKFQVVINAEQIEVVPEGPGANPTPSSDPAPQPSPAPTEQPTIPEEPIPGGEVVVPEEPVPGGEVIVREEPIPGGSLPKTGGVSPSLVYSLGMSLLAVGVGIYRKCR